MPKLSKFFLREVVAQNLMDKLLALDQTFNTTLLLATSRHLHFLLTTYLRKNLELGLRRPCAQWCNLNWPNLSPKVDLHRFGITCQNFQSFFSGRLLLKTWWGSYLLLTKLLTSLFVLLLQDTYTLCWQPTWEKTLNWAFGALALSGAI